MARKREIMVSALQSYRELSEFRGLLTRESDRGAILLGCSLIEQLLEEVLKASMIDDQVPVEELLTRGLETFSARILAAQCFGAITKRHAGALNVVRKIRNTAAHEPAHIDFTNQSIIAQTGNLFAQLHRGVSPPRPRAPTPRGEFEACSGQLFYEMTALKKVVTHHVGPRVLEPFHRPLRKPPKKSAGG